MQKAHSRFGPITNGVADTGPGNQEDRAHRNAHSPAVERIAAGGRNQNGVYPQCGCRTEDSTHVRMVHDALQHRDTACLRKQIGWIGQLGTPHGAEHAPCEGEARQTFEHFPCTGEHGDAAAIFSRTGFDDRAHGFYPLLFH